MEFTLLAAALGGVACLWIGLRATGPTSDFDLAVTAAVVGMFGGRIVAMVLAGVNPLAHPLDVVLVRGGVDPVGATLAALAYLAWASRSRPGRLDALGPAALAGLAGWHAGCLWRGTCLGAAGDVPWGWSLAGSDVVRHPVELYTAGLLVAAAVILTRASRGRAGLALAAAAGARLLTEGLRPGLGDGPAPWYGAGVAAGIGWFLVRRRGPRPPQAAARR
ncbi:MAG: prolipoprotein diacylglyceryl transferase family protein [Actinomycetota bacterium]